MFSIKKSKFGKVDYYQLHNDHTGEYVGVIPEAGGLVNDFYIESQDRLLNLFESYKNYDDLVNNLVHSFKGSKLSPYPNRIKEGKYQYENEEYAFDIDFEEEMNSIHGILYKKVFDVISTDSGDDFSSILLRCDYDGKTNGFPFRYRLEQEVVFSEGNQLTVTTTIENKDIRSIPMADGWHPYIKTGARVDELSIQFPSTGQVMVDSRGIPTEEAVAYTDFNEPNPIGSNDFDDCFMLPEDQEEHVTTIVDHSKGLTIDIWQQGGEKAYNYLQVYTPEGRESIAIEPMTCIPNAFNNEVGLISLAPQEKITLKYGMTVVVD